MPEVKVEIEVWCSCGEGLCRQSSDAGSIGAGIIVEPCEICLENRHDEGYEEGYSVGYDEGQEEGFTKGLEANE